MNSTVPSIGNKFRAVAGSQSSQIQPMYFMAVAGSQSSQIQPRCFMVAMQPEKPIEICTFLIFSVHLYSYNIFTVQLYLLWPIATIVILLYSYFVHLFLTVHLYLRQLWQLKKVNTTKVFYGSYAARKTFRL